MPSNKRHHYVPKFYLRNFSPAEGKTINIYSIVSEKNILNASLRKQCYINRFYGEESKIEHDFHLLEGLVARLIKRILETKQLPSELSPNYNTLFIFVIFQNGRTKQAANQNNEIMDKHFKTVFRKTLSDKNISPNDFKVSLNDPIGLPLQAAAMFWPVVRDLKSHLLFDETDVEFMTSDNPVLLYNQYCQDIENRGSTGLASVGLQIFFPLSSKAMLLLYDGAVYEVGESNTRFTQINDRKDVLMLNRLQWYNALENIYYKGFDQAKYIKAEALASYKLRNSYDKLKQQEYVGKSDGFEREFLVHLYNSSVPCKLNTSFMRVQERKKKVPLEKRLARRDPQIISSLKEFFELVQKGRYKGSEFATFLQDKS